MPPVSTSKSFSSQLLLAYTGIGYNVIYLYLLSEILLSEGRKSYSNIYLVLHYSHSHSVLYKVNEPILIGLDWKLLCLPYFLLPWYHRSLSSFTFHFKSQKLLYWHNSYTIRIHISLSNLSNASRLKSQRKYFFRFSVYHLIFYVCLIMLNQI